MHSHLTRLIFHRILSNKPITHKYCINGLTGASHRPRPCGRPRSHTPARSFVSLFKWGEKTERQVKDANFAPGVKQMAWLSRMLQLTARPPPDEPLNEAFQQYILAPEPVYGRRDFEFEHAIRTFDYLKGRRYEPFRKFIASHSQTIMGICLQQESDSTSPYLNLAHRVYAWTVSMEDYIQGPKARDTKVKYFKLLVQSGAFNEAQAFSRHHADDLAAARSPTWVHLSFLSEHVKRRNYSEAEKIWETLKLDHSLKLGVEYKAHIAGLYASIGDIPKAIALLSEVQNSGPFATREASTIDGTVATIIRQSWLTNKLTLAEDVVRRHIEQRTSSYAVLAQVLAWAAANGKTSEELERMMDLMRDFVKDPMQLDTALLNALIEYAVHRKDPYLAERYMDLAARRQIRPDDETYILQATWRLNAGDIEGAKRAIESLRSVEDESASRRKVDLILNRYLDAIIKLRPEWHGNIVDVTEWLGVRRARFEPVTASSLCLYHLEKDEFYDVIDLLQTNAPRYAQVERTLVCEAITAHALDSQSATQLAWDVYMIVQRIFDEMPRQTRMQYMIHFYERERPDLAIHVFDHMRRHKAQYARANIDTYVEALRGIASNGDSSSLRHVYNQLKMDVELDPDTRLNNALMLAFGLCGDPTKAFNIWNQIADSREGPSYQSIVIIFRVCEKHYFGDQAAVTIWQRLRRYDIELDMPVLTAYIGALAVRGRRTQAFRVIESAETELGLKPDVSLLAVLLNNSAIDGPHQLVVKWIEDNFPALWAEMQPGLRISALNGLQEYPMKRDIKI